MAPDLDTAILAGHLPGPGIYLWPLAPLADIGPMRLDSSIPL